MSFTNDISDRLETSFANIRRIMKVYVFGETINTYRTKFIGGGV